MIHNSTKHRRFFDKNGNLIKSKRSKIPEDAKPGSEPISFLMKNETDTELINFIE